MDRNKSNMTWSLVLTVDVACGIDVATSYQYPYVSAPLIIKKIVQPQKNVQKFILYKKNTHSVKNATVLTCNL